MTMKKLLAVLLALTMVLSLPLAVSAEEWTLVCGGWWTAHSAPVEITETIQSWTFTNTTDADATGNYHSPIVVVWSGEAINGTNYVEEGVMRSDIFGWGGVGSFNTFYTAGPADWAAWVESNKTGVPCTVTAQLVGDYIVVGINCNGVVGIYYMDNDAPEGAAVKLSMTGEKCTLTGWTSTTDHVDISSCVAALTPSEDDSWKLVCGSWWSAHSAPVELSETIQSWTFTNTTNADATLNWNSPVAVIWSGEAINGTGYVEEGVVRSDLYTFNKFTTYSAVAPSDWAAWVESNKTGVPCTVTAQIVGDQIVVGMECNGVVGVYYKDIEAAEGTTLKLSLSGELCVLTDWESTTEHVDISACVASLTVEETPDESTPDESTPDESTPDESTPDESTPDESTPDESTPDESTPDDSWVVDCPTWWGGHSEPVEVTTEKQSWTFTNTSYPDATDNWDTATVVIWRSDDGTMGGPNYLEELLARSDSYAVSEEAYWGTDGQPAYANKNYPADWAAWLEANKAGAQCTITAQLVDGWIVLGFSNNGVTNVYSVPMNTDLDSPVYLSLTGEQCKLTGWQATDNHLDITIATSAPADGNNPKTGDLMPIVVTMMAVMSLAGIVVLNKKRLAV